MVNPTTPFAVSPLATPASAPPPGLFDGLFPQQQTQQQAAVSGAEPWAEVTGTAVNEQGAGISASVPTPEQAAEDEALFEQGSNFGDDINADPNAAPQDGDETEVAAVGQAVKKILKGYDPTDTHRLKDVPKHGATSGVVDDLVVVREATQDEVDDFNKLIGKTSGVPSPTKAQEAAGIPTANFNLDKIDGPDALKETIDKISELWKAQGIAQGRGVQLFADTERLAKEMGFEEAVDRLLRSKPGDVQNAEGIRASLMAVETSAMELNRLAMIAQNSTDSRVLLQFRQHLALQGALETNMKGLQVEAARAFGVFRMPRGTGANVDAAAIDTLIKEFGGDNSIRELAKDYLALPTQGMRNKFTMGAWDKVKGAHFEVFINGLLSGIQTQFANLFGNAGFQLMFGLPVRLTAGTIGGLRSMLGSKTERVFLSETLADAMGLVRSVTPPQVGTAANKIARLIDRTFLTELHVEVTAATRGIGEAWTLAHEAFVNEAPVRDLANKILTEQRRVVTGANMAPNRSQWFQRFMDRVGVTIRIGSRGLMTVDEFFKAIAYRREINSQAVRKELSMRRKGFPADDIEESVDNIFLGLDDEAHNAAIEFAQVGTFTDPIGGLLGKAGAAIQGSHLGRMVVPFYKIAVNLASAGVDHSPIGVFKALKHRKILGGKHFDPVKRDIAVSKAIVGSTVMAYSASAYLDGRITGSGPSNYKLRKDMEAIGWKRWSFVEPKEGVESPRWIQIGHRMILHPDDVNYYTYENMDPASMVLSIGVDVAARLRWPLAEENADSDLAYSAVDTIFEYMNEQSFMTSFAKVGKILSGKEDMSALTQQLVGAQVPFSSMLASIERINDPTQVLTIPDRNEPRGLRDLYAALKRWDDRFPLSETDGPILRDRFGRPVLSKNAKVLNFLLPPFVSDIVGTDADSVAADPVLVHVLQAGIPIDVPSRTIEGVRLTDSEYEQLVLWAADPPGSPSFYSSLKKQVNSKIYLEGTVAVKQTLIKAVDEKYKDIARTLMTDDPRFEERFFSLREKIREKRDILNKVGRQQQ